MVKLNFLKKINIRNGKLICCSIFGAAALFSISFNFGERLYVKQNNIPDTAVFNSGQLAQVDFKDEIIIYDEMHRMANSKLSSDHKDKSGKLEINSKQLEAVREIVKQMNYPDKNYIFEVIDRWDKGNFDYIGDEHNYFWIRLGGNAGPAAEAH
ncbi:hypothetical protein JK636_01675 [Clostridium sp. YIM B02515]|uniref:Uncharacterized protein n=1 Tax=Clostridium rhizosphaerae TaxID=2803861 RepID=A0ABS1T8X4_9CLOT|nr:DUF6241 domain-containing protein [Clostridium rhizosphaerae]MBL4934463.1 hypothetical protein [Clostridium rhizosphaerae]